MVGGVVGEEDDRLQPIPFYPGRTSDVDDKPRLPAPSPSPPPPPPTEPTHQR